MKNYSHYYHPRLILGFDRWHNSLNYLCNILYPMHCIVTLVVTWLTVTQDESNRTWGRSTLFRPEEFDDVKKGIKKKGRTWGPSSVQSKERPAAAERYCLYTHSQHTQGRLTPRNILTHIFMYNNCH